MTDASGLISLESCAQVGLELVGWVSVNPFDSFENEGVESKVRVPSKVMMGWMNFIIYLILTF